jgi:hypothetical protein
MKMPDVRTILALTVGAGVVLFGLVGVVAIVQGRTIGDNLPLMVGELLAMIVGGLIGGAALASTQERDKDEDE